MMRSLLAAAVILASAGITRASDYIPNPVGSPVGGDPSLNQCVRGRINGANGFIFENRCGKAVFVKGAGLDIILLRPSEVFAVGTSVTAWSVCEYKAAFAGLCKQ